MRIEDFAVHARRATQRLDFDAFLRTGHYPDRENARKFNPYHDPADGRFTFAPGGSSGRAHSHDDARLRAMRRPPSYVGMTRSGVGRVAPTSGGGFDAHGKFVPESFPPDRYRLSNPVAAVAHYVGGSGAPRNYYFDRLDTSKVRISTFAHAASLLRAGKPGTYPLINDSSNFETDDHFGPHYTIGGIELRANGVLIIGSNGRYTFDGRLSAKPDENDYDIRPGRTPAADRMTAIGRQLPGKIFTVYLIGSKPFSDSGHRGR